VAVFIEPASEEATDKEGGWPRRRHARLHRRGWRARAPFAGSRFEAQTP